MGTLERLRKTSPYFLAAFALVFIGFMVASDADISSLMKQGQNFQTAEIGVINGEKILYKDFENKVREQIEQQRTQNKDKEEQNIDEVQIRRQVWQQMVDDVLLRQEAEKVGIFVTDEEVLDVLFDNPPEYLRKPFTDSLGRFQKDSYLEIVSNPEVIMNRLPQSMAPEEKKNIVQSFRNDLLKIQKYIREEKFTEGMRAGVSATGMMISPLYAKQKYLNENSTADVNYIHLDLRQIPDNSITVSDTEIEKYYEKISKYNKTKAKRKLKFTVFQLQPSDKDTAVALKAIKKIANDVALAQATSKDLADSVFSKKMKENQGQTFSYTLITEIPANIAPYITNLGIKDILGPVQLSDGTYFFRLDDKKNGDNEVVKASHILINFGTNKDSAKAFAVSLMEKAKKGDFAALAREHSEDKGSATNGGDLGFFGKGRMVKPFEEAAYGAKVGSIVGPIESQFGFHIIKVTDKKSEELKYSQIKVAIEVSRQTIKLLSRDARELKNKVDAGTSFDEAAKFFKKAPRETDFFEMDKPIFGSQYLSAMAFETEVGKVIEPLDLKNVGYVVAQVVEAREAGVLPLKDLKDKIKTTLIKQKKIQALKAKATEVFNQVKNSGNLLNAAGMIAPLQVKSAPGLQNNGTIPGAGQDFGFTEKCFSVPAGVISEPFSGENGWYIVQVSNRKVPDENTVKAALPGYINQVKMSASQTIYYQWLQKVKEDAKIKDLRSKFYKEY